MKVIAVFLAGFILAVILGVVVIKPTSAQQVVLDVSAVPTITMTRTPTNTVTPMPTVTPLPTRVYEPIALGIAGEVQCFNCAPFSAKVRITNYDPLAGDINCFDYADGYCWSPTSSGLHWKAVWGFAMACPMEWPLGTWVQIDGIGSFICLDRGEMIKCMEYGEEGQMCYVDILSHGDYSWNGGVYDATLWVPLNPPRQ